MLSKDLMSNVDENVNESKSLGNNPIMSNEDQDQHDPFELPNDDNISFSRLLFDLIVCQVQPFDSGDANLNMLILDNYIQMSDTPPWMYMFQQS